MTSTAIPAVRPVYFPHTFLPPEILTRLQGVFRSLTVLQPASERLPEEMQPFADCGFLDVLRPPGGGELESTLRGYQQWGDRHREGIGLAAAWHQDHPSGREETAAEIAASVRRRAAGAGTLDAADPPREAGVFLQLAQTADRQRYHVARSLRECDNRHLRLFDTIRGQAQAPDRAPPSGVLAGRDHMPQRMAAWIRCFLACPCPLPVFATHDPGALEWLLERSPAPVRFAVAQRPEVLQAEPAGGDAVGHGDVATIRTALGRSLVSCGSAPATLTAVHLWTDLAPPVFFARVLHADADIAPAAGDCARHTVLLEVTHESIAY